MLRGSSPLRRFALPAAVASAALALSACGSQGSPVSPPLRGDLESIFEPKGPLFADPVGTLQLMRRLGVGRVKVYVPWSAIAPGPTSRVRPHFDATQPGAYPAGNWTSYDTIVRDAQARGIALDMTVGPSPPLWAAGPNP